MNTIKNVLYVIVFSANSSALSSLINQEYNKYHLPNN